jgi:hypothetical protein
MQDAPQTFIFMLLIYVLPFGCALLFGALTEKLGQVASGLAGLAGLGTGIYMFSLVARAITGT